MRVAVRPQTHTAHAAWQFFAVSSASACGFTWHWQKHARTPRTSVAFDYYFDCITDARAHGYSGPLPAGPRIAPRHLPLDIAADPPRRRAPRAG